ncbi:unnamed protein product [Rhizoctonia solani]|uniref:Ricin B lectin domain-containing protein n=1 Tax=Rhizoctonia solani TaxID=456999 RepID=A0A8H3B632_9AGAM|nr:unnamed protein product [Rhizoctonia solani]
MVATGYYQIRNVAGGTFLTLRPAEDEQGRRIVECRPPYQPVQDQIWRVVIADGYANRCTIQNVASGRYLARDENDENDENLLVGVEAETDWQVGGPVDESIIRFQDYFYAELDNGNPAPGTTVHSRLMNQHEPGRSRQRWCFVHVAIEN